jgi:type IV pilus assembly protein PilQ
MLVDKSYSKSLGIDWSTLVDGKVKVNAGFSGASQVTAPMNLSAETSTEAGNYTIDINTLLKTIETEQKRSILAKPNIRVSNAEKGIYKLARIFPSSELMKLEIQWNLFSLQGNNGCGAYYYQSG